MRTSDLGASRSYVSLNALLTCRIPLIRKTWEVHSVKFANRHWSTVLSSARIEFIRYLPMFGLSTNFCCQDR